MNIYGVLVDQNVTRTSTPSLANPTPFSHPRYTVWVNSLWFLSLVMSLSCALWATSLHQWARRYIRLTQPARCSPEKRARMRAFFADGVEKMHIPWAVEGLPTLLHLSLFLFFGGLAIFLFNVDHEVFTCVVLWIGFFSVVYVLITLLPLIRHDSPYYTPLSIPAWFPYATMRYATFEFTRFSTSFRSIEAMERYQKLRIRYLGWILGGMEKTAAETASEQSSDIDIGILDWTISALGDDDSLERFCEAIPGFFKSKLVNKPREGLPRDILIRLRYALGGFLGRTLTSNSIIDSVKLHRLDIFMNAITSIPDLYLSPIIRKIFLEDWNQWPQPASVEMGHTLAPWCTSNHKEAAQWAQGIASKVLVTVRERNDRWVELAATVCGLPEREVRQIVTHGDDSVSLAILIHFARTAPRSLGFWEIFSAFTVFDIHNSLPGLQHDFCTLWNEVVQEAENQGLPYSTPVCILREIRHHYIALHQGTDAAPTAFSPSTDYYNDILFHPSSYPSCKIAGHRPLPLPTQPTHSSDAPPGHSTPGHTTVSLQVQEPNAVAGPCHSTINRKTGDSSPAPAAASPTLPVHTPPRPSDASPPGAVVDAPLDIPPAETVSHPLEGTTQQDVVVSCKEPGILSAASMTAPTLTLASEPESKQPVLNKSSESYDTGAASTSNPGPLPPSLSVTPTSPRQSCPPPPPIAESLALPSSATPPRPSGDAALSRLRVRGLVNTGSMCFANAVLQLLVHSPPLWTLFRGLGGLTGQRGVGGMETGSEATPLLDATMRFLEEFVFKEEPPPSHQEFAGGKMREGEDAMKEHNAVNSFEPTYMYDAMKEKRLLKYLLVRSRDKGALLFLIHGGLTCIGWPTA